MKRHITTIVTVTLVVLTVALGYYYYSTHEDGTNVNTTSQSQDNNSANNSNNSSKNTSSNTSNNNQSSNTNTSEDINSLRGRTPDNITEPTYINGVMLANKKHPLPRNFNPGEDPTARANVNKLIQDAQKQGLDISNQVSGFRSYDTQVGLYNNYVAAHGQAEADRFSARPGYSEHQTGLVFDLIDNEGSLLGAEGSSASSQKAAQWVADNAYKYGFIVRYQPNIVEQTGYMEEAWHLRYVGSDIAKVIHDRNISLEEYLNALGGDYIK